MNMQQHLSIIITCFCFVLTSQTCFVGCVRCVKACVNVYIFCTFTFFGKVQVLNGGSDIPSDLHHMYRERRKGGEKESWACDISLVH